MEKYKEAIATACRNLAESRKSIMGDLINVSMSGEYADVDSQFEIGDLVNFSIEDFSKVNDVNAQKLYQLLIHLENCRESLININGLSE